MFEERIFIMTPTAMEKARMKQMPDDPRSKQMKKIQKLAKAYKQACAGTDEALYEQLEHDLHWACKDYDRLCAYL